MNRSAMQQVERLASLLGKLGTEQDNWDVCARIRDTLGTVDAVQLSLAEQKLIDDCTETQ